MTKSASECLKPLSNVWQPFRHIHCISCMTNRPICMAEVHDVLRFRHDNLVPCRSQNDPTYVSSMILQGRCHVLIKNFPFSNQGYIFWHFAPTWMGAKISNLRTESVELRSHPRLINAGRPFGLRFLRSFPFSSSLILGCSLCTQRINAARSFGPCFSRSIFFLKSSSNAPGPSFLKTLGNCFNVLLHGQGKFLYFVENINPCFPFSTFEKEVGSGGNHPKVNEFVRKHFHPL